MCFQAEKLCEEQYQTATQDQRRQLDAEHDLALAETEAAKNTLLQNDLDGVTVRHQLHILVSHRHGVA